MLAIRAHNSGFGTCRKVEMREVRVLLHKQSPGVLPFLGVDHF